MNFGNGRLRRFTELLDRTAEKHSLLWLPCVLMLAVILGTAKLVRALKSLISGAEDSVRSDGMRKPFVMRAGAFVIAAAFTACVLPDFAEIGVFAEENDVQQEIADNASDGVDDDIFKALTVNDTSEDGVENSEDNTEVDTDAEDSDTEDDADTDTDTDTETPDAEDGTDTDTEVSDVEVGADIDTDTDTETPDAEDGTDTDTEAPDAEDGADTDADTDTEASDTVDGAAYDIDAHSVDNIIDSIVNDIKSVNDDVYTETTADAFVKIENKSGEYFIPTSVLALASGKDIDFRLKGCEGRWYTFRFSGYVSHETMDYIHTNNCGILINFPQKLYGYDNRAGDFAASRDFSGAVEISSRCGSTFDVTCTVVNDNHVKERISVFKGNSLEKIKFDNINYGMHSFECGVANGVNNDYIVLFSDHDVRYIYERGIAVSLRKVTVKTFNNGDWNRPHYGYNDYFDGFDDRLYVVDNDIALGYGNYYESGEYVPLYALSGITLALKNYIRGSAPNYYDRYIKYEIKDDQSARLVQSYDHDYVYIQIDGETDKSVVIEAMPADAVENPVISVDKVGVNDVIISWDAVKGVDTYYVYWQKYDKNGACSDLYYSPFEVDKDDLRPTCQINNLDEDSTYRIYVLTGLRDGNYEFENRLTIRTNPKSDDNTPSDPGTPDKPDTPSEPDTPKDPDTPSAPVVPAVPSDSYGNSSSNSGSVVIPVGYTYTPRKDRDSKDDMFITLNCDIEKVNKGTAHISTRKEFFDNSAELYITNSDSANEAAAQVMKLLGENASYYTVYPFDVSLYDADSGDRITLKNNGYITVELPTPKVMRNNPERIKVYHIKDGLPEYIESEIVLDDKGRPIIRFAATEFSDYMFVSPYYEDVSSAAGVYDGGSAPVETAVPAANGVTVPSVLNASKELKFSNKKRRYRILRRRKLDDLVFVY